MLEATQAPKPSLREGEKLLDRAASMLDVATDIGFREALRLTWRTTTYVKFFKARIATKMTLGLLSMLIPLLVMPWPAKIVVDHVILGQPIPEDASGFPVYFAPFVQFLDAVARPVVLPAPIPPAISRRA